MPVSEHLQRLFKLIEEPYSESQHRKLLFIFIVWMFVWAVFYGFKYNEGNITGDLVHQVTTALSRLDPTIFSNDYIYSDRKIMAFYSPQQIWSIATLYRVTGSMSVGLAILQFIYSAFIVFGAWLVAKQLTRNVWIMLVIMLTLLQYTTMSLNGGWVKS
jgi:hypothetical protein